MTIRIKFCGGCNPRFDRAAAAEKLRAALPEAEYLTSGTAVPDYAVMICGCFSRCADAGECSARRGQFFLSAMEEMDSLIASLKS